MTTSNYQTPETLQRSEICKALFCYLYFSDLKLFLSNFNLVPKDKVNSLNMGFLLNAYDHNNEDHRNDCKWQLGMISDSDLMLAIEEYYEITNNQFEKETLYTEREDLLLSLFKNDTGTQVSLGDQTLRAILQTFNVPLESNHLEMRGMAKSYRNFTRKLANPFNSFWPALDLLACNRNWNSHTHDPRYAGIELHLFHRYVLFTYIGLIYVCRRIWNDTECIKVLGQNGIEVPTCISKFSMPKQNITVNVTSPDVPITKCRIIIGSGKTRETKDHTPNPCTQNYSFIAEAKKYKDLTLKFYRDSVENEIHRDLNYQSWFISYDVKLPDYIKSNSCDTTEEPTFQLLINLFGALDNKSRDFQNEISMMVKDIKDILIASITRQNKNDRSEYDGSLHKMLEDLNVTIANSPTVEDLKLGIQNINKSFGNQLEEIKDFNAKFKEYVEKSMEPVSSYLSWTVPLSCFIISGFVFLLTSLYPFKANIFWLQPETKIIAIISGFLLIILPILSFAHFNPKEKWINKLKFTNKWQWLCIGAIILLLFASYFILPYKSQENLIEKYDFLNSNSKEETEAVVHLVEKCIKDNPSYEEDARIFLTNYYVNILGDLEKARLVSSPLLNIEKYKKGSLYAMTVLYEDKDQALLDYIEQYGDIYGRKDPDYCDIKGAILVDTAWGYRDIQKGVELLWNACDSGSINAFYNLGYLYSNDESTMESNQTGRDIQFSHYDLYGAIKLLKHVSDEMPNASILLGDIYTDLNMVDSAITYYEKAITNTKDGSIYIRSMYKLGIMAGKYGIKPNNPLLDCITKEYPPAQIYSSISIDYNEKTIEQWGSRLGRSKDFCRYIFGEKDHVQAIKRFTNAMKRGSDWESRNLGIYQYIPPVVFSYIYIDDNENASALLQKYRPKGKFDHIFIKAVASLIGTANTKQDTIKGMQLMHESANNGCLFAEMYCIYKDGLSKLRKNKSAAIDLHRLKEISKEIPFAHVVNSLLLMESGKYKEAEEEANMAMWKKHPAGAFAFEFMPAKYYDDYNKGIINGADKLSDTDIYYSRKMQESIMRMTWTSKEKSLLMSCLLDKLVCERDSINYTERFRFWTDVALANESYGTMILLLHQYKNLIEKGDINNNMIIDPLLRGIFANILNGNSYYYPKSYTTYFLKFLKKRENGLTSILESSDKCLWQ